MKILLAVDGSPISSHAVKHVVKLARQLAAPAELVLFHADPPLMQAVAVKLGVEQVSRYHADNSRYATRAARTALTRAHVPFTELLVVGEPAEAIVRHAGKIRAELIVMGSHGHGALQGLLLGSVATKVIAHAGMPVTVVR